jgi:hypothetical protein
MYVFCSKSDCPRYGHMCNMKQLRPGMWMCPRCYAGLMAQVVQQRKNSRIRYY